MRSFRLSVAAFLLAVLAWNFAAPPPSTAVQTGPDPAPVLVSASRPFPNVTDAAGAVVYVQASNAVHWYETAAAQEQAAAELAARQAAVARRPRASSNGRSSGGGRAGGGFACIRAHESDSAGGYSAVNPNGHYGAYQFSQSTWDATARRHGRGDLVGVRPDQASAADQDQMAQWLQADAGWGQWSTAGSCGL